MKASLGTGREGQGRAAIWSFFLIIIIIYSVRKSEKVPVLTQVCFSKLEPFLSSITSPDETTLRSNKFSYSLYLLF